MLDVSMEVYKALRTLFTTLLVPGEEGSPTEIIAAYQNANCPKMPYLAISKPSFKLLGSSPFTQSVVETTVPGEDGDPDTVVYTQTRVSTFLGTATVTEVGGAGNMLSYIAFR